MTPLIPARRAAEEFARVVDGSQVDVADRYSDLTACVEMLRIQETPAPRAEFVADLRTRLMAAADTLLVPADAPAQPRLAPVITLPDTRRRRHRHLGAAAAAIVFVGGTAGVAAAAEGSLPGDPLYPIKRSIESAMVSLNSNDAAKGRDLIAQASTRLDEIDAMLGNGASTSQVKHTLASFERSASSGADLLFVSFQRDGNVEDLASLRSTFGDQSARITDLARQAPAPAQPAFADASALLSDLDQQARVLCGDCGPDSGVGFTDLTSAPALSSLLTQPAAAAAAEELASRNKALADKAAGIAEETPQAPLPTDTTDPGTRDGLPGVEVPSLPTDTDALGSTVKSVTGGVQGLLDEVDSTTGGVLTPLTDTLDSTLDAVTGLLAP